MDDEAEFGPMEPNRRKLLTQTERRPEPAALTTGLELLCQAACHKSGDSGRDRTYDLMLRRHVLYPTELRSRCPGVNTAQRAHARLETAWPLSTNMHAPNARLALKSGSPGTTHRPRHAPSAVKRTRSNSSPDLQLLARATFVKAPYTDAMAPTDMTATTGTVTRRFLLFFLAVALQPSWAHARERKGVHLGAFPIANFSSDAGYTVGALAQRFDYGQGIEPAPGARPFQSLLTLQATYASQGPRDAWVAYEAFIDPSLDSTGWRWAADFYAMESNYQRYYGLGPETQRLPSLEAQGFYFYDRKLFWLGASIRKKFLKLGGVDFQIGAAQVSTRAEPGQGANGQSKYEGDFGSAPISQTYTQLTARAIWERRNSEFIPTRGSFSMISLTSAPFGTPADDWSRLDLDFRRYFEIIAARKLWLASQARYSGASSQAPLHEKARLGSLGTFRGVALNRYLSNHSASLRNELRSMWYSGNFFGLPLKLGSGVYVDAGRVSEELRLIGQSPTRLAWGIAFFGSYFTDDFLGSADFGFSKDGSSLYLRLGHAF